MPELFTAYNLYVATGRTWQPATKLRKNVPAGFLVVTSAVRKMQMAANDLCATGGPKKNSHMAHTVSLKKKILPCTD